MKSIYDQMKDIQKETPHYLDNSLFGLKFNDSSKSTEVTELILLNIKNIDPLLDKTSLEIQGCVKGSISLFLHINKSINSNFSFLGEMTFTQIAVDITSSINYIFGNNKKLNIKISEIDIAFYNKINPKEKLHQAYLKAIGPDYRQKFNKEFEAEHFDLAKQVNPKIKRAS